jgi:hypothetical protein
MVLSLLVFGTVIHTVFWNQVSDELLVLSLTTGGILILIASFFPSWLVPCLPKWEIVTSALQKMFNETLLFVMFFFVIFPYSLVINALGVGSVVLKVDKRKESYLRFVQTESKDSMKDTF